MRLQLRNGWIVKKDLNRYVEDQVVFRTDLELVRDHKTKIGVKHILPRFRETGSASEIHHLLKT